MGQTTGWLRAKLSFAILRRVTNLCLRGSRTKWGSGVGIDDVLDYRLNYQNLINTFLSFFYCVIFCLFLVLVVTVMVFHRIRNIY